MNDRTRRIVVGTVAGVFVIVVLALQFVDTATMGCSTEPFTTNAGGVITGGGGITCSWWSLALPAVLLFGFVGALLVTISWSQRRRRRGEEASSKHGEGGDIIGGWNSSL
ncbi:MAG TPA: hypothetical protein VK906_07040 [Egicoccus sp.]|nr:hypothetical protein [Egicoccus sp.]HSK22911.1 hypothetical protein [Egicoccus sp.]